MYSSCVYQLQPIGEVVGIFGVIFGPVEGGNTVKSDKEVGVAKPGNGFFSIGYGAEDYFCAELIS